MKKTILVICVVFISGAFIVFWFLNGSGNLKQPQSILEIGPRPDAIVSLKGIIESIDPESGSLVISLPNNFNFDDISYIKVYFTDDTEVTKRDLFQKDGIIYAPSKEITSSLAQLHPRDKVIVFYQENPEKRRLEAVHILYGYPFPAL